MPDPSPRQSFRARLHEGACLFPATLSDPLSARLAYDLGIPAGMLAGSIVALSVLGDPDHGLISLSELAEQTRRVSRAAPIPIIVDADHGYGNALNVGRTVEELEHAGAAAITIEDTALPQPFGAGAAALLPLAEGLGKVRAALDARRDPDLVIVGRTSAAQITGLDDAIARGKAYEDAGADALFFSGIRTRAALERLARELHGIIFLGGGAVELRDADFLAAHRVRVFLPGHDPYYAAIEATRLTLIAQQAGTLPAELKGLPDPTLIERLSRSDVWQQRIFRYLTVGGDRPVA